MPETLNESTSQPRCGHAGCLCSVPAQMKFCSDYCEQQARAPSAAQGSHCGCAHAPCDENAG